MNKFANHKFYKTEIETEYGKGVWIAEVDESGWSVRQAEIYSVSAFVAPEDMNFYDFKLPEGFGTQPYKEISSSEFGEWWEIVKERTVRRES